MMTLFNVQDKNTKIVLYSIFFCLLTTHSFAKGGNYTCEDIFNVKSIFQLDRQIHYKSKRYNPFDADSVIKFFTKPEIIESLKRMNPNREHLEFFEDDVYALVDVLGRLQNDLNKDVASAGSAKLMNEQISQLGKEAFERLAQKKITYFWLTNFMMKVSNLKENLDYRLHANQIQISGNIASGKHKQDILDNQKYYFVLNSSRANNIFSSDKKDLEHTLSSAFLDSSKEFFMENIKEGKYIVLPVIARLSQKQLLDFESSDIFPMGIPLELSDADGITRYRYLGFSNHDLIHTKLSIEDRERAGAEWMSVHHKIYSKIEKLKANDYRYTLFLYFYLVRELNVRKDIVNLVNYGTNRKDYIQFDWRDLMLRLNRPHDLGDDFRDVENKQEILRIGLGNLNLIIDQIRKESRRR